jgi:ATP-dependent RNA helicase RhlE
MRQTLLFSATFSDEIRKLSAQFLKDPATIEVARRNAPVEIITQYVHLIDANRKRELLSHLVRSNNWEQVLVFCKTKHGANRLASQLQRDHINADAIHGNKSQGARIRALEDFKVGKVKVLVATDIAARGLDIEELPHVVNFDLPHVPEDYVHRIGRTGRAGCTGEALSLVAPEDRPLLAAIERLINKKIEVRGVDGFGSPQRSAERPAARTHAEKPARTHAERPARTHAERPARTHAEKPARTHADEKKPAHDPANPPMDFNKPYEPAPKDGAAEQPDSPPVRKRGSQQPIPALFRRRAA